MSSLPGIGIFGSPLYGPAPVAGLLRLTFNSGYHAKLDKQAEKSKVAKQIEATK